MKRALKLVKMVNGKAGRFVYLRCKIGKCGSRKAVKPVWSLDDGLIAHINMNGR